MEIIFGIVRWVVIIALLGVVLFRIFRIIITTHLTNPNIISII